MPNQLQSNAMVWLYFTDDAIAKKGKCLYCNQLISYEKSTFSNLTRHLKRKHPEVLGNVSKNHLHYVWNHYTKEPEMKAKCLYCQSCISCPHNSVSNMIRHMKYKHPSIPLVNHVEFIQQEEERLYDEQDSLPDAMEESFKEPELEMESNGDRKIHQDDQEVIEEIVHDTQSQLYVTLTEHMPAQRSNLWSCFKKDPAGTKAKCLLCGQLMSLAKSTFTNLRRHIQRRHPHLLEQVAPQPYTLGSRIWVHFVKEPGKRARCRYCGSTISYQYTTSSLARHMRIKHPNIELEGEITPDAHSQDYEKLYQDDAVSNSVEGLISVNESDGEFEGRNGGLIELQPVKNAELSEPIKLEIIDLNPQPKRNVEQEQEEIVRNTRYQSGRVRHYDQGSIEHNDSEQEYDMTEILEETVIGQIIDPIKTADTTDAGFAKYENTAKGQNPLAFDMRNIPTKAAAYATHVALEIESLHPRQRAIAQKLISDILFNGKLENLTEHSMLIVRVGTFEHE
uniref:BED-type domain-containing protein n=1 Tax=Anopheles minimus TaxID=112268 RepID=A0A182VUJ5_9DIPT